jgi:hypothetical protein
MYLSIAQKNKTKNKKQPPTNIQTRKQTSKHHQQKQTLTDNNQWRRKELINVRTVRFGFLLQDTSVPGQCHGINLECLIYRQQENLFKTTFNIL